MPNPQDVAGTTALSICGARLLARNDRHIPPQRETVGIRREAAAAQQDATNEGDALGLNAAVALAINGISGGNSIGCK
jgi:hypothetical protein